MPLRSPADYARGTVTSLSIIKGQPMSTPRIRPRTAIASAELARTATVELPVVRQIHRPHTPRGLARTIASFRRPLMPERTIVVTLPPVFRATPLLVRLRAAR
jgi:hypothetical protein